MRGAKKTAAKASPCRQASLRSGERPSGQDNSQNKSPPSGVRGIPGRGGGEGSLRAEGEPRRSPMPLGRRRHPPVPRNNGDGECQLPTKLFGCFPPHPPLRATFPSRGRLWAAGVPTPTQAAWLLPTSSAPAGHLPLKGKALAAGVAASHPSPLALSHLIRLAARATFPSRGRLWLREWQPPTQATWPFPTSSASASHLPLKGKAKAPGVPTPISSPQ